MSRDDGFAVMDVSTAIVNDTKFGKVRRLAPDHANEAFIGYVATLAESWSHGRRVSIDDAWPPFLPFSKAAVEAMIHVGLLDARGMIPAKAWRGWFEPARKRRGDSRDRWARYNAKRNGPRTDDDAATAPEPRGNDAATATSVPPGPSVPPAPSENDKKTPPPPAKRGLRETKTNPRADGTSPRQTASSPRYQGTSPRQERQAEKRGRPEALGAIIAGLAARTGS